MGKQVAAGFAKTARKLAFIYKSPPSAAII